MIEYAYIPIAKAAELPNPESYGVRIAVYVEGYPPDILDSNGQGIPNILEMEGNPFTEPQKIDIEALGGQWFQDAAAYLEWKQSLIDQ